jgi:hypothetical protein
MALPSAITCAENIALLSLLHRVPVPPSLNPINNLSIRHKGYILSFRRERSLASMLAFLSSISDNPDHVTAVCVEEDHETMSLSVLLAINKAQKDDNNQIQQNMKQGFERIFAVLAQVSDGKCPRAHLSLLIPFRWPSTYRKRSICCNYLDVFSPYFMPSTFCCQQ